jgi:hypothetical protein
MFSCTGEEEGQFQLYEWRRNKEEYMQIEVDAWK